jgi:hypothetical protein
LCKFIISLPFQTDPCSGSVWWSTCFGEKRPQHGLVGVPSATHCLGKNCLRSFRDFTIISGPSARLNRSMQNGSHLKVIFDFEFWSQNFVGVWCNGSFALVRARYSFHEVLLPKLRALESIFGVFPFENGENADSKAWVDPKTQWRR